MIIDVSCLAGHPTCLPTFGLLYWQTQNIIKANQLETFLDCSYRLGGK